MSKREISVELFQCDYKDENGLRCANDGNREAIRICCVCGKDVCKMHSDLSTITVRGLKAPHFNNMPVVGQYRYVYSFCVDHVDELKKILTDRFGDSYEVPSTTFGGAPSATGTPSSPY